MIKLSPCSEKRRILHPPSGTPTVVTAMTQLLCDTNAIASSSAAAVAEKAAQVGGVPGMVDDMYFLRHILDMEPSNDDSGLEIVSDIFYLEVLTLSF